MLDFYRFPWYNAHAQWVEGYCPLPLEINRRTNKMQDTTATPSTMINVSITKGKSTVEVDTAKLPDEVYQEALKLGLKTLMNRGMSKITKTEYPKDDELKAAAMAKAAKNLEDVYAGKIRIVGGRKKVATGAINIEARRLSRNIVKDELKRQGKKVSHYKASEITKAADALIEVTPSILEEAKANVEKRLAAKSEGAASIVSTIQISEELVSKAEKRKSESKAAGLSAKQAGKVKTTQREANA